MALDELMLRRAVVLVSALVYWGGVLVQARRVRRHIGRSPNVGPQDARERVLWLGWFLVVAGWMSQPFLARVGTTAPLGIRLPPDLLHVAGLGGGVLAMLAGYAGTLWCYRAMGDAWRMGLDHRQKTSLVTRGPYRWVRHPIYSFQSVMLVGAALLLPTLLSVVTLTIHLLCVAVKTRDEEAFLLSLHGQDYRDYLARTGRLLPRFQRSE